MDHRNSMISFSIVYFLLIKFYDDGTFGTSGDAILYVYESIQLNANEVYTNLSLQKGMELIYTE